MRIALLLVALHSVCTLAVTGLVVTSVYPWAEREARGTVGLRGSDAAGTDMGDIGGSGGMNTDPCGSGAAAFPRSNRLLLSNAETHVGYDATIVGEGSATYTLAFLSITSYASGSWEGADPNATFNGQFYIPAQTRSVDWTMQLSVESLGTTYYQCFDFTNEGPRANVAWHAFEWGDCSFYCNNGTQYRDVACYDTATNEVLDNWNCDFATQPSRSQRCFGQACALFNWVPMPWGACSEECGVASVRSREVVCQNTSADNVTDDNCLGERPPTSEPCEKLPCVLTTTTSSSSTTAGGTATTAATSGTTASSTAATTATGATSGTTGCTDCGVSSTTSPSTTTSTGTVTVVPDEDSGLACAPTWCALFVLLAAAVL